jgi:RNA polymerase sigma-70 factor (ECF subfamily)
MTEGPERGLELVDAIDGLDDYYLFHATRAEFLRRLGEDTRDAYARALELAPSEVEREFLRSRAL